MLICMTIALLTNIDRTGYTLGRAQSYMLPSSRI
jgi:hypothetical protein